jgi:hypothetical protein
METLFDRPCKLQRACIFSGRIGRRRTWSHASDLVLSITTLMATLASCNRAVLFLVVTAILACRNDQPAGGLVRRASSQSLTEYFDCALASLCCTAGLLLRWLQ